MQDIRNKFVLIIRDFHNDKNTQPLHEKEIHIDSSIQNLNKQELVSNREDLYKSNLFSLMIRTE